MFRSCTAAVVGLSFLGGSLAQGDDDWYGQRYGGSYRYGGSGYGHDGGHHHHHGHHWHGGGYGYPDYGTGYYYQPGISFYSPGFSFSYGYPPYAAYSPFNSMYNVYGHFGPSLVDVQPGYYEAAPPRHPQIDQWLNENRDFWQQPVETLPVEDLPRRFIKPSSTEAQLRSIRLQHDGDLQLRGQQYALAAQRYRDAIDAAPDRADPYFHSGFAEAARGEFPLAARRFKLGLQLDPTWPSHGDSLDDLLGEQNLLSKTQIKQHTLEWVQQDIRDPDRLFVLGVLLHFDNDAERAAMLFESAARLGGNKEYLAAFLNAPADQAAAPGAAPPPEGAAPPVPRPPPAPVPQAGAPARVPEGPVRPAEPERLVPPPPAP